MPYVAKKPGSYSVVGGGECVDYVKAASGAPATSFWTRGDPVRNNLTILEGTAIATFDAAGKYGNKKDGTSHAAIYVSQDGHGIEVWDQWAGQPVHRRPIRFQGGAPNVRPVNDGDAYYVIE